MQGFYYLTQPTPRQFLFTLHTANGQLVLTSEPYAMKAEAQRGIEECQESCSCEDRYLCLISIKGEPYFILTSAAGKVIGTSRMFATELARDEVLANVKQHGTSNMIME